MSRIPILVRSAFLLLLASPVSITVADGHSSEISPAAARSGALDHFRGVLKEEAAFGDNPWALAHGILAFGTDFKLAGDDPAAPHLLEHFLRDAPQPHFDRGEAGGAMGEMHSHLVLKTLSAAGYDPDVCGRLGQAAVEGFRTPESYTDWDDTAWFLESVCQLSGYDAATELTPSYSLADFAGDVLRRVEEADAPVEAELETSGVAGFRRVSGGKGPDVSGIWAYTCGGQHLLQASLVAFHHGLLPESDRARLAARVRTFVKRVEGENGFRDREMQGALAAGVDPALARHQYTILRLKLNGHALETLARARDAGILPAAELSVQATKIRDRLADDMIAFEGVLQLAKLMPSLRATQPEYWRKWFGDGCHAIHGLSLWPELTD